MGIADSFDLHTEQFVSAGLTPDYKGVTLQVRFDVPNLIPLRGRANNLRIHYRAALFLRRLDLRGPSTAVLLRAAKSDRRFPGVRPN